MTEPELRDLIQNEISRVLIQNHPNFSIWFSALGPHGQQVIQNILDEDVTPELILFAQEAPEEEWDEYIFLRMIGGGNPNPAVSSVLTNLALGDILRDVRELGKSGD